MANVTLRKNKIANNKSSLYLDYFPPIISPKTGQETRREFLKLKIYDNPSTSLEKEHNKSTFEFANLIRAKRLVQLKNREYGFKENIEINFNFIEFYDTVVTEYYNKGSRANYLNWKASFKYFIQFAGKKLSVQNLSPDFIKKYRNFLLSTTSLRTNKKKLANNTASKYFSHFILVLRKAFKEQVIGTDLSIHADFVKEEETFREYLTEDELVTLWNTEIKYPQIKRAALFSALTGLRFVDIQKLTWEIVYSDKHQGNYIRLKEKKTGNIHNHPITKEAYTILLQEGTSEGIIFKDFKYYRVALAIKNWITAANINKKITFHNFRHSYASLQLANGTDIYTISKLMGHKNVSTTQIYTKVMDKNKIEAANRINLNLNGL